MFGAYLNKIRTKQGMTVEKLAEKSGVSGSQISRIETSVRGTPKPATIKKLAEALRVPYVAMLDEAGYIEKEKKATQPVGLGKASEIKHIHIFDRLGELDRHIGNWQLSHGDALIISIQFSTHYCHSDEATICNAFIIYKEGES